MSEEKECSGPILQSYCRKDAIKETWRKKNAFGTSERQIGKPFILALKCSGLENKDVLCTLDPRFILQCFKL